MKITLGLDLGVSSIGWALISEEKNQRKILGMGSRIIPLTVDDKNEFSSGNAISKNQMRTQRRTQRKGYDRYQLRRGLLIDELRTLGMLPGAELYQLEKISLWGMRSRAVTEKLDKQEVGRILLLLNQKRGYKSSRSDANLDKKDTEYVAEVKTRYQNLSDLNLTIGQYFYNELTKNPFYRIKEQVFPREAYLEEFNKICSKQREFYPDLLKNEVINKLRDVIIYYQRPLKSQKGLVSICEFEGFGTQVTNSASGKTRTVFVGPRVAPKSSPLFQVCKIWESINTIKIKDRLGEEVHITLDQRREIFVYLDNHEKLSFSELLKLLKLKASDGYYGNDMLDKGIQGNLTKAILRKKLGEGYESHLKFDLDIRDLDFVDETTGEVFKGERFVVSRDFEREPLYQLWHIIYSIQEAEIVQKVLMERFGLDDGRASALAKIDFSKQGFGNKSSKAIRKILPYLMNGMVYSQACQMAGFNHSGSISGDENLKRELAEKLTLLDKNSLRQPVVEKILNQMINQVNAIIEKFGRPDEIRVELARELQQSKVERNRAFTDINQRERENDKIANRLTEEYGLRATRNNVIKYRLFKQISGDESTVNAVCIYCGKPFGFSAALSGSEVDIEHIIPKSKLFDDSQSNKTLTHRKCNADKGDRTAYDYMKSKSNEDFDAYVDRVDNLYKLRIIARGKRDRLLMSEKDIPQDFISRQLRQTQYISRKAREILAAVCFDVWASSGTVTDYVRRIWGWDDVLMNLQISKYREAGLTEWKDFEKDGQVHHVEVIKDWTKRNDHRHHAVDALAIACSKQGIIQKLNTLGSEQTRDEMFAEVNLLNSSSLRKRSLVEAYIANLQPFPNQEVASAASSILVSFKAGKKAATRGVRKVRRGGQKVVVQTDLITPRGALSEETVYGKIMTVEKGKPVKYLFENSGSILKQRIKKLVEERIFKYEGDWKLAFASIKKDPIWLDPDQTIPLSYGSCYKEQVVVKYPVSQIKTRKDIDSIVDQGIRRLFYDRIEKFAGNEKDALKNLDSDPVWFDEGKQMPIRSVRCLTGLEAVESVRTNADGKEIGFVKPGNNHHVAIYETREGKLVEHICTFWHAVERVQNRFPVVIKNPDEVWDEIFSKEDGYKASFMEKLPETGWTYKQSMQQNEMFLLGLAKNEVVDLIANKEYGTLSEHLYRVQKLASRDYVYRHHLETEITDSADSLRMKRYYRVNSLKALELLVPVKVKISLMGEIDLI